MMTVLLVGVAAWLGLSGLLYLMQDNMIFYPQRLTSAQAREITRAHPGAEEITFASSERGSLHGWFVKAASDGASPVLVYFGGNAEEASWMLDHAHRLAGCALVVVNYRGYGLSEGKPSERALLSDALLVFDEIAHRPGVDSQRIVVLGRSLGSGVAVHVAAKRAAAGVVLVSPFDSLREVARRSYPFVPVRLLLRHPFDSLVLAPSVTTPLLVIVGEADAVIPVAHSRRLFDAWAGPKTWLAIPGAGHNGLDADPGYWDAIEGFLRRGPK